jgi:hypothetical protein
MAGTAAHLVDRVLPGILATRRAASDRMTARLKRFAAPCRVP